MAPKNKGENTKKAAGNAQKAEAAAQKEAAQNAKKAKEEGAKWDKGAKDNSKSYAMVQLLVQGQSADRGLQQ